MIPNACWLLVSPVQLLSRHLLYLSNSFEHGNAVSPTAPEVIHFAGLTLLSECFERLDYIIGVNIIADLLPLVAKYRVGFPCHGGVDKITEKSVKLYARVTGAG